MSIQFCSHSDNCAVVNMFSGADESCLMTYLSNQGYDLVDVLDTPADGVFIVLLTEAAPDEWVSEELPLDFAF